VTVVILPYIKTATESRLSLKDNGCVGDAFFLQAKELLAYFVHRLLERLK
jgi:hypothetical protein